MNIIKINAGDRVLVVNLEHISAISYPIKHSGYYELEIILSNRTIRINDEEVAFTILNQFKKFILGKVKKGEAEYSEVEDKILDKYKKGENRGK